MFCDVTSCMTFKTNDGATAIYHRIRSRIASCVLMLACVAIVSPASALTLYDGDWSVVIVTRSGACDPSYRVGVQIAGGAVGSRGLAAVRGQVTSRGSVKVTVRSGSQWAYGSGFLRKYRGSGVWTGQGNSGACGGKWLAERRG